MASQEVSASTPLVNETTTTETTVAETTTQVGAATTTQTSTLAPGQAVQEAFQALLTAHSEVLQGQKDLHRSLTTLSRQVNREYSRLSRQRTKRVVVQTPVAVSKQMVKFMNTLGVEGKTFTRRVMMKAVSGYVKANDLQLADNRKCWTADAKLARVFKKHPVVKGDTYSFLNINGFLSSVVTPTA